MTAVRLLVQTSVAHASMLTPSAALDSTASVSVPVHLISGVVPRLNDAAMDLVSAMISTMFLALYLMSPTCALVHPMSAAAAELLTDV
ncbi:hypothetical protein MSAN_01961400 [Mycena sanguinolenta]|uniref:Uncharacterized protein n=1 Tax=Mycena sanguinolenta TaxID=230812 RepID=A0A8H6XNW1_9AGAR|nr:hypothetical protein MSAN_01961400 [Mycena sanguinolenta]